MALISCPECGKEISDRAKVCPNCGYPIEEYVQELKEKDEERIREELERNAKLEEQNKEEFANDYLISLPDFYELKNKNDQCISCLSFNEANQIAVYLYFDYIKDKISYRYKYILEKIKKSKVSIDDDGKIHFDEYILGETVSGSVEKYYDILYDDDDEVEEDALIGELSDFCCDFMYTARTDYKSLLYDFRHFVPSIFSVVPHVVEIPTDIEDALEYDLVQAVYSFRVDVEYLERDIMKKTQIDYEKGKKHNLSFVDRVYSNSISGAFKNTIKVLAVEKGINMLLDAGSSISATYKNYKKYVEHESDMDDIGDYISEKIKKIKDDYVFKIERIIDGFHDYILDVIYENMEQSKLLIKEERDYLPVDEVRDMIPLYYIYSGDSFCSDELMVVGENDEYTNYGEFDIGISKLLDYDEYVESVLENNDSIFVVDFVKYAIFYSDLSRYMDYYFRIYELIQLDKKYMVEFEKKFDKVDDSMVGKLEDLDDKLYIDSFFDMFNTKSFRNNIYNNLSLEGIILETIKKYKKEEYEEYDEYDEDDDVKLTVRKSIEVYLLEKILKNNNLSISMDDLLKNLFEKSNYYLNHIHDIFDRNMNYLKEKYKDFIMDTSTYGSLLELLTYFEETIENNNKIIDMFATKTLNEVIYILAGMDNTDDDDYEIDEYDFCLSYHGELVDILNEKGPIFISKSTSDLYLARRVGVFDTKKEVIDVYGSIYNSVNLGFDRNIEIMNFWNDEEFNSDKNEYISRMKKSYEVLQEIYRQDDVLYNILIHLKAEDDEEFEYIYSTVSYYIEYKYNDKRMRFYFDDLNLVLCIIIYDQDEMLKVIDKAYTDVNKRIDKLSDGLIKLEKSENDLTTNKGDYSVRLIKVGPYKVNVMKVVMEATYLGFEEAVDLIDKAPIIVKECNTKEEAEELKKNLEIEEAVAEIIGKTGEVINYIEEYSSEEDNELFHIKIEDVGPNKLKVIKVVKDYTGYGLDETKDMIDRAPCEIDYDVNIKEASAIKYELESIGAKVSII